LWDTLAASVHKYSRSNVLVIGGSPGRYGAPVLSGLAAIKAGAGIVSIALPHHSSDLLGRIPIELVAEDIFENGNIHAGKLNQFISQRNPSAIVIGPGCLETPLTPDIMSILQEANRVQGTFIVFDAGAITALEQLLSSFPMSAERCLITPHPGEWKRFGVSAADLNSIADLDHIRPILSKLGISLLYKTATPFSVFPDNSEFFAGVNISGDISLSKAGTGDILSGIAATVGSRDIPAWESGLFAYSWLSAAAKHACSKLSINGVSAVDILNALAAISR
jgi:NAD(P)H-hydrate epimerase